MNRLDFGLLVSYSKVEHRMILTESVVKCYNSHCARYVALRGTKQGPSSIAAILALYLPVKRHSNVYSTV